MLARRYHDERCQNRLLGGVRVGLGRFEPVLRGRPRRDTSAAVGQSAAMSLRLKASVAGQIAFEPKPSASRWYEVRSPSLPAPEKTVRIVTVWPSSRRLAMSPPHESATSSGWGATKTWVMAGRVYRDPATRPARSQDQPADAPGPGSRPAARPSGSR